MSDIVTNLAGRKYDVQEIGKSKNNRFLFLVQHKKIGFGVTSIVSPTKFINTCLHYCVIVLEGIIQ